MKKKRIIDIALVLGIICTLLSGCHYLDLDEETASLTEEQVFATYSRSKAFLDGAIDKMQYTYPLQLDNIFIYGGSWAAQTDAADTGSPNSPSTAEFKRCNLSESVLERYSYIKGTATTGGNLQMSRYLWIMIRQANKSIEHRKVCFSFWKRKCDRFEKSNATRMSVAADSLMSANLYLCHRQKCKQIWPAGHMKDTP